MIGSARLRPGYRMPTDVGKLAAAIHCAVCAPLLTHAKATLSTPPQLGAQYEQ